MSASGVLIPCRTDSVPMMWATTLCTDQPGSGVGVCHCCSDNPVSNRSRLSQVSKRPVSTSDLSSSVTGREGLLMPPDVRPVLPGGDHADRYCRQNHAK